MPIELTVDIDSTEPIKLSVGQSYNITIQSSGVYCIRLIGMHFETNKCFLLPDAMTGIKALVDLYTKNTFAQLLIVGHTDTAGDDDYNLKLSLERAEAVKAFLKDDIAAWENWFKESVSSQKKWGIREIQHMLRMLPEGSSDHFYSANPSGLNDNETKEAVKKFQTWEKETRGKDLKVDGDAGPLTRHEIIAEYMALDGTSLPDTITPATHGCGEFFLENDTGNGVANENNRRVECFAFKNKIKPQPPSNTSKKGSPEYPAWCASVNKYIDFTKGGIDVLVTDEDGFPLNGVTVDLTGTMSATGITDIDGRAHFVNLENGSYKITVHYPGLSDTVRDITIPLSNDPGSAA